MYIKLYVCIYCKYNVYNVGLEFGIYVYIPLSLLIVASFQGVVHVVHLYNNCQRILLQQNVMLTKMEEVLRLRCVRKH